MSHVLKEDNDIADSLGKQGMNSKSFLIDLLVIVVSYLAFKKKKVSLI